MKLFPSLVLASLIVVSLTIGSASRAGAALSGTDWSEVGVPSSYDDGLTTGVQALTSCAPESTFCMAIVYNTDVQIPSPDGGDAVGQGVLVTSDGVHWTSYLSLPSDEIVAGLSCPAVNDCVTVGAPPGEYASNASETTDGGQSWTVLSSLPATVPIDTSNGVVQQSWEAFGISCPTASDCYIVGTGGGVGPHPTPPESGVIIGTEDGGQTWTTTVEPQSVAVELFSISCESPMSCVAVGDTAGPAPGVALSTTDGGATWLSSPSPTLDGVGDLVSVSCAGDNGGLDICMAIGYATTGSAVIRSTDGGVTWSGWEFTGIPSRGGLYAISCATADDCWAMNATPVGDPLYGTADGGSSWASVADDDAALGGADGLSCALSKQVCIATVDGGLWETTDGGGWGAAATGASVNQPLPPTALRSCQPPPGRRQ
ncbi:MAG TPA: hypothetical protein VEH29_08805 [Acidimicrobiales bacterium]|nr:hypothetical protein [Acidimicrobiales bacterium]